MRQLRSNRICLCQASVCGAICEVFLIKRIPQLLGLAGQTVFAVIQMFRALLNRAVVGLVAMNQPPKAIIFIVYRLAGGLVKLFCQIAFGIVEILVFQRVAPLFLGNTFQNVIGVADLFAAPLLWAFI